MKVYFVFFIILSWLASPITKANKDVNIYIEILGNTMAYTPTFEVNINQFNLLGAENRTYFKVGASMFSLLGMGKSYSFPVVGINHFIGQREGIDIGIVYFHKYYYEQDLDIDEINSIYDFHEFDGIGFNFGYREYWDKYLYRLTYTPFYNLTEKEFFTMFGISFGWFF